MSSIFSARSLRWHQTSTLRLLLSMSLLVVALAAEPRIDCCFACRLWLAEMVGSAIGCVLLGWRGALLGCGIGLLGVLFFPWQL